MYLTASHVIIAHNFDVAVMALLCSIFITSCIVPMALMVIDFVAGLTEKTFEAPRLAVHVHGYRSYKVWAADPIVKQKVDMIVKEWMTVEV